MNIPRSISQPRKTSCLLLKLHLNTRIEVGNNDFGNQRTQVSKNSYVVKNLKCPAENAGNGISEQRNLKNVLGGGCPQNP